MEKKKPLSDIHVEDYLEEYAGREKTAADAFFTGGREKEALDGLWHYAADPYDTCLRQHWYEARGVNAAGFTLPLDFDFEGWPTMTLPCCWNTAAPEFFWYESTMVFTRRFRYLPKKAGERVFLRVGAANYALRVFLNGRYLGSHTGGSTPAFFELTEALQTENRILLTADASRRPRQVPPENTDWFNYGGVYRELELYRLPGTFIREFFVRLKPGSTDRLLISLRLSDPAEGEAVFSLPEKGVEASLPVSGGTAEAEIPCPVQLWTPEAPKLYDVALRFGEDRAEDRVGFRDIRTEGLQILLNGKPLFLRGVSCHEDAPERGKALTEEDCEQAILEAKALGCNFMRLAHYPHTEKMALLADRLGMLLWEEIPVYWAVRFSDGAVYAEAENQLSELILRDRNRASVILWSVGNENADTDERFSFMSRLAAAARERDGSRLITAACMVSADNRIADRLAEVLDVIGLNEYFGWYSPDLRQLPELFARSRPAKPVIISEFGADALFGHHGTAEDKGTVECQAEIYRRQTAELAKIPCVRGMTPWILYDFRCPRRTHPLQGYYNRKGLVDADRRRRKPAWYVLRDFYEKKKAEE
jgi:beta-glucuronidase